MKPMVYRTIGQNNYVLWNFAHITDQCGTIEFRGAPGVKNATDAKFWASFALGFSDGNLAEPPEMVRSQQIDGGWGCMLLVRYRLRLSGKCQRSGAGSVADQYTRMLSYPPE
jgi:hypothetical protein